MPYHHLECRKCLVANFVVTSMPLITYVQLLPFVAEQGKIVPQVTYANKDTALDGDRWTAGDGLCRAADGVCQSPSPVARNALPRMPRCVLVTSRVQPDKLLPGDNGHGRCRMISCVACPVKGGRTGARKAFRQAIDVCGGEWTTHIRRKKHLYMVRHHC
jgi:hypothetical protein